MLRRKVAPLIEVITLSSDDESDSFANLGPLSMELGRPVDDVPRLQVSNRRVFRSEHKCPLSPEEEIYSKLFRVLTHGTRIYNYDALEIIFIKAFSNDTRSIQTSHIPVAKHEFLCKDHTNDLGNSVDKFTFYAEMQLLADIIPCGTCVVERKCPKFGDTEKNKATVYFTVNNAKNIFEECVLLMVEYNYIAGISENGSVTTGTLTGFKNNVAAVSFTFRGRCPISKDTAYTVYLKPNCVAYDDLSLSIDRMSNSRRISEKIFGHPKFDGSLESFHNRRCANIGKFFESDNLNQYQKEAIFSILSMSGHFPFVLFGPPGTGKTTTLVHAIKHILNQFRESKILVCTPSNAAADNFTLALKKGGGLSTRHIFRLMSTKANLKELDLGLMDVVLYDQDGFIIPPANKLARYLVVVSTIGSCSRIKNIAEFTHILIDEAGQAAEAEVWIPLACFGRRETKLIIAGDPQQLGPVLIDPVLENPLYKFEQSLLVRLSVMQEYQRDDRLMVQLRHNYRSHESVVIMASTLFYDDTLIATHPEGHNAFAKSEILGEAPFPMIFHAVYGNEVGTHGFYNQSEINVVDNYVRQLLRNDKPKIQPADIGIVSPYRDQASKLKQRLIEFPEMTIDTVERFQGSERKVIIITTTRSRSIGFLRDRRRINTAITRARQLLIIVGNPRLLYRDPTWKGLIDCFSANNCLLHADQQ